MSIITPLLKRSRFSLMAGFITVKNSIGVPRNS